MKNYLNINKESWNNKVDSHYKSDFYDNNNFIKGKSSLNAIELEFLQQIKGKSVLHLQCHFGQDSISLNRLGADVIGVDLSDKAIEKAKELAKTTNSTAQFICCDIYDLPNHLDQKFDFVFSSYGTIGWLPDIKKWAKVVSHFLKPNGQFIFAEFHPVMWMFDDDFKEIKYRYFNSKAIVETEVGTYATKDLKKEFQFIFWNHGLAEVISSLLNNGLSLTALKEYDYSPYDCVNNMVEFEPNKFRIRGFEDKLPLVYLLVACKL